MDNNKKEAAPMDCGMFIKNLQPDKSTPGSLREVLLETVCIPRERYESLINTETKFYALMRYMAVEKPYSPEKYYAIAGFPVPKEDKK